jgi:hypothetical protein
LDAQRTTGAFVPPRGKFLSAGADGVQTTEVTDVLIF